MIHWLSTLALLAQEAEKGAPQAPGFNPFGSMMIPLILVFGLFYVLMIRPQQRQEAKRNELLKSLKKNDRVVTAGGIIGSIASITPEGTEVTLKVDDNTRIRLLRSSIQRVISSEGEESSS